MLTAITRKPSPALNQCALEYATRRPIDFSLAAAQHRDYETCLADFGLRVISLPSEPDLPDAAFVEDPVIVVDELAVIARMGLRARQPESSTLAETLRSFRPTRAIREPATIEGGDILRIGRLVFAGVSTRTNPAGLAQLASELEPHRYTVIPAQVGPCLHLKTACSYLGNRKILANRAWIDVSPFSAFEIIDVDPDEPWSANVLRIADTILIPASFPRAARIVERAGFHVQLVDISELMKAEAGLTCLSLIFEVV